MPRDGEYLTTLGAAQYRVGNAVEAAATLTLAGQIAMHDGSNSPGTRWAFLALTYHCLGNPEKARAALGRLHRIVNEPGRLSGVEVTLYRELEALEEDLAFPADPFAH